MSAVLEVTQWVKTATPEQMEKLLERIQEKNPDDYHKVKRLVKRLTAKRKEASEILNALKVIFMEDSTIREETE